MTRRAKYDLPHMEAQADAAEGAERVAGEGEGGDQAAGEDQDEQGGTGGQGRQGRVDVVGFRLAGGFAISLTERSP